MAENAPNISVADYLRQMPRRDNTAYHKAMSEARQAMAAAETVLGGPVKVESDAAWTDPQTLVVKFTFTRA